MSISAVAFLQFPCLDPSPEPVEESGLLRNLGTQRAARALAVRPEGQHAVQVWLDQLRQPDHHRQIESLFQARRAEQVPRVDHEINKPEAQERRGRDITVRSRNRLPRGCGCEGKGLAPGRLGHRGHRGHRIVSELISCEHLPGLDTANPANSSAEKRFPTTTCSTNARTEMSDGVSRFHEPAGK